MPEKKVLTHVIDRVAALAVADHLQYGSQDCKTLQLTLPAWEKIIGAQIAMEGIKLSSEVDYGLVLRKASRKAFDLMSRIEFRTEHQRVQEIQTHKRLAEMCIECGKLSCICEKAEKGEEE